MNCNTLMVIDIIDDPERYIRPHQPYIHMKRKTSERESRGTAYQPGRPRRDGARSFFRRPNPDQAAVIASFRHERHARFLDMMNHPEESEEHKRLKGQWEAIREAIRRYQRALGFELDD